LAARAIRAQRSVFWCTFMKPERKIDWFYSPAAGAPGVLRRQVRVDEIATSTL